MCNLYVNLNMYIYIYICIYPRAWCTHAMIFLVFRSFFGTNNLNLFVGPPKGELRNILITSYHIKMSLLISATATHDGAKKPPGPNISKPVYTFEKNMLDVRIRVWWVDGLTYAKPK